MAYAASPNYGCTGQHESSPTRSELEMNGYREMIASLQCKRPENYREVIADLRLERMLTEMTDVAFKLAKSCWDPLLTRFETYENAWTTYPCYCVWHQCRTYGRTNTITSCCCEYNRRTVITLQCPDGVTREYIGSFHIASYPASCSVCRSAGLSATHGRNGRGFIQEASIE